MLKRLNENLGKSNEIPDAFQITDVSMFFHFAGYIDASLLSFTIPNS